jgi:hypothetical protein
LARVFVLPVIRREDCDAFKRDAGLVPTTTFERWTKLLESEAAEARRQGKTVVEAEINYTDFKLFCARTGENQTRRHFLNSPRIDPLGRPSPHDYRVLVGRPYSLGADLNVGSCMSGHA